jgi:hypothetical protein
MQLPPPIPLAAFLEDPESLGPNADLLDADVILGVDVASQKQFIVYGRKALRRLVRGGPARGARVVRIALSQDTEDLPQLLALVVAHKGRHEYEPEGE